MGQLNHTNRVRIEQLSLTFTPEDPRDQQNVVPHLPKLLKNAVSFCAVSWTPSLHFAASEALDCGETEITTNFCSLGAAVFEKNKQQQHCWDNINVTHAELPAH